MREIGRLVTQGSRGQGLPCTASMGVLGPSGLMRPEGRMGERESWGPGQFTPGLLLLGGPSLCSGLCHTLHVVFVTFSPPTHVSSTLQDSEFSV